LTGFLHRITPAAKLVAILALAVATTSKQEVSVALPALAYLVAVAALGGVDFKRLARDAALVLPFLVGLPLGNALIAHFRGGDALAVGLKALSMLGVLVMMAAVFAYTTSPDEFAYSLARQLKLPQQFALSVGLTYGFLVYALTKYARVLEALKARWLVSSPLGGVKYLVPITVSVIDAVYRRVDNVAIAMEMKGFGSSSRTYWRAPKAGALDYAFVAASVAVALFARLVAPSLF